MFASPRRKANQNDAQVVRSVAIGGDGYNADQACGGARGRVSGSCRNADGSADTAGKAGTTVAETSTGQEGRLEAPIRCTSWQSAQSAGWTAGHVRVPNGSTCDACAEALARSSSASAYDATPGNANCSSAHASIKPRNLRRSAIR